MSMVTRARRQLGSVRRRLRSSTATPPAPARMVTDDQLAYWNANGFLVLPGFFTPERMAAVTALFDELWSRRAEDDLGLVIDVFIDTPQERRIRFKDAPDEARAVPYKLYDLYLVSDIVRELVLDHQLVKVLDDLLDGAPLVCNSLSFERGSQQRFHFDTFYMPPVVTNKMLATWIALEPADMKAGPLQYYPASHTIPPYRFEDGRLNATFEELPAFDAYIDRELVERGLQPTVFTAAQGDVFIWHAQLYHGGAPIDDVTLTRRSLVTHYFRAGDMDPNAVVDIGGSRYYMRRPHQAT